MAARKTNSFLTAVIRYSLFVIRYSLFVISYNMRRIIKIIIRTPVEI